MKITCVKGDATRPQGEGTKIIVHICNDIGAWGAGFVLAVSRHWPGPEESYRKMSKELRILGQIRMVPVEDGLFVANMIAQHGIGPDENGNPPIRYDALRECLKTVNEFAVQLDATVHMPRIGCGLAGGEWNTVEKVIEETLDVDVTVYDL